MKTLLVLGLGSAVLFSGVAAIAQDAKAPASGDKVAMQSMPMMAPMDEHMKKMQALHDRMMSATTAAERQKVMDEARAEVRDGMAMMKPMMQAGGMMAQQGNSVDANGQMQVMDKRMDMMQSMMQMMMDEQAMMTANADKAQKEADRKKRHFHPRDGK